LTELENGIIKYGIPGIHRQVCFNAGLSPKNWIKMQKRRLINCWTSDKVQMKISKTQKIVKSAIGALVAILLFISPGLRLPVLDSTADNYFSEATKKAVAVYATCRIINASVSIIKESDLNLEPAGIGITLAVGQALDPIDDMTERLSDVLVTAITSLGVQKLAYQIGVSLAPQIVAIFLLLFSILIWFENEQFATLQKNMVRLMLLILIARFALPISAIANNYIQEQFFEVEISETNKDLEGRTAELDKLKEFSLPESNGTWGTIKNSKSFLERKSMELKNAFVSTYNNSKHIIENLLKLTFLYVGVFLIQVIALPIITFWLLVKFTNALLDTNVPIILHHAKVSKNEHVQQIAELDGKN